MKDFSFEDEGFDDLNVSNGGVPTTRSKMTRRKVHYSISERSKISPTMENDDAKDNHVGTNRSGGTFRKRTKTSSLSSPYLTMDSEDENIRDFDNYEVKDITLEFFYKPHTLTLLAVSLSALFAFSWYRDDSNPTANLSHGFIALGSFFVLGLSVLVFPNGPFVRPHPAIWRIVFGASMLYLCALVLAVNLSKTQIQEIINYFDSSIDFSNWEEKEYAKDCWDLKWENVNHRIDVFVLAHFLGYVSKAVMMRSSALCWTISVMWEITEMLFMHVLPNFEECLWDQILLDVVLCNGFGIFIGMRVCNFLEMREYDWESIKYINSASGKMKRALLQFTPMSWHRVQWFDTPSKRNRSGGTTPHQDKREKDSGGVSGSIPSEASEPEYVWNRIMLVFIVLLLCQVNELNCFCLKHIFRIPTEHVFNWGRLILLGLCVCPTVRQYYTFTTDTRCRRLGTQTWVFVAINAVELFAVARFGWDEIFAVVRPMHVVYWLLLQLVAAILCVYSMILYAKYFHATLWKTKYKLSKLRRR